MEEKLSKAKNYIEWIGGLLIVALGAYFAASLVLQIVERKLVVIPKMIVIKKLHPDQEKTRSINEYIQELKTLFPEPAAAQDSSFDGGTSEPGVPQDVQMKLVATIIGDDTSIAVINVSNKDEVVGTGQKISKYEVKSIEKNRVILEHGRKELILKMKFGEQEPEPPPEAGKGDSEQVATTPGMLRKEISRREFETMTNPPDRVARDIGFAPVSREEKPYGIQLTFVKPGSLLQRLGFLPGDILKNVNKKPVYSPEDGMMAYQMMKNEDTVDFDVDRGGRFIHIQILFK